VSVHDVLLLAFCLIDDELQDPAFADARRQRGPEPLLTDSEVLTIELVGEFLGYDRDARLFWFFRHYHHGEFPNLALVHRTTFARQAANLLCVKQLLQRRLAERLLGDDPAWLVDSMPVPIGRFRPRRLRQGLPRPGQLRLRQRAEAGLQGLPPALAYQPRRRHRRLLAGAGQRA